MLCVHALCACVLQLLVGCLIAQKWNEFQEAGGDSRTQAAFVWGSLEEVKARSDPFELLNCLQCFLDCSHILWI